MIVQAKNEHLKYIVNIEKQSFRQPWTLLHFVDDLNRENISMNYVFISENEHEVAGYLFGYRIDNEYHLNNIAVHQKFRRNKIGTKLLEYLFQQLINLNVKKVFLEVSANNLAARKLYESMGFIPTGLRKDYYTKGDDALLYTLELKNND